MLIGGLQKSSFLDYPGEISAIVFTQGCNFACPYCHNPELIKRTDGFSIEESSVIDFLKNRKDKLDAVVISGGEPCLQKDLVEFVAKIKKMGFLIKLDTNGSYPETLQKLIDLQLIDYVAMDIKAPIDKYKEISNSKINTEKIAKSINILRNSSIDYEFRTTIVKSQLEMNDFDTIGKMISGSPKYYLQKFLATKTLDKKFMTETTYSDKEFEQIKDLLQKYISYVELR